jgi:glycosyltransferase involved in cell wall biosynthesis
MRKFSDEGHQVHIVSSVERRFNEKTQIKDQDGIHLLQVKTLNVQKTNIVEKGFGTLLLEYQFHHAIHKYFSHVKFDLILYSTPPITLTSVIRSIRKRDKARTYLLLKDIFPQNAVDIGMLHDKGLLYQFFRFKEKILYNYSDFIGCMSPANVRYLLAHNPSINPKKVEVNPNSIELSGHNLTVNERNILRNKCQMPVSQTIFVYGGNLGKPQGIDFLMEVIIDNADNKNAFFLIVGSGTEFNRLNAGSREMNLQTPD